MVPILLTVIVVALGITGFMFIQSRKDKAGFLKRGKGKDADIKTAQKRLAQNPLDPQGLLMAGAVYYEEQSWDKAYKTYAALLETGTNDFEVYKRYGLSAMKKGIVEEAVKGLAAARVRRPDDFEVNYNLGVLEFQRNNYEKAVPILQQAQRQNPEHASTLMYLGRAFFKIKKYKEAMSFIRRAIDIAPDDKEALYTLGECYLEANQLDQAVKIFSHLRADPVQGPRSCLMCGTINLDRYQYDKAIADFEIGLKHKNIKPDVALEIKYKLAIACLKKDEIGQALKYLREIQQTNASYKDVAILLGKYQELNANKNLQIFLLAPSSDFVALCRKIVLTYFGRVKIKISNISVNKNEWADMLAEVDTPKWSDTVMFRFIRSQGAVGELIVRDFHSHLKEANAGKGICITVGTFTDEAKRYTEARLIDLIDKEKLAAILNTVDAKAAALTSASRGRK
ncbi:MAG: tetratricopeptide repeat protein [Spirochaetaceae bacterium]|jgi:tetratricopeptide (TPR) repeat protein|nr:tetratricopeptide repeat protein [Spirochaetaceae bacterium]